MTTTDRYGLAVIACALAAVLATGCGGDDKVAGNIPVSPLEARGTSLFDVADAQRTANDKLLAAQAVAETEAEKATVTEAEGFKKRGDDFFDQKAYGEAHDAYQKCIRKCDEVISAHVSD